MLENLEQINWQMLTHVYGEADDVADSLRDLTSCDVYERARALYTLYDDIWHQGRLSEATAATIPFLIELLGAPLVQEKDAILDLLAHLATSEPENALYSEALTGPEPVLAAKTEIQLQELVWIELAHDAVRQGIDTYLALFALDDPKVRMGAAYVLACLPECAAEIVPQLRAWLGEETDQRVKACVLLSLEVLVERNADSMQIFKDMLRSKEPLLVRLVAAMALARLLKAKTPVRAVRILVDTLTKPELIADLYDELPWAKGSVVGDISLTLRHLRPGVAQFAIPSLVEALATVSVYSALNISRTLLYLAFNDMKWKDGSVIPELTGEQRLVLTAITNNMKAWDPGSAMYSVLEASGFPGLHDRLAG